MMQRDIPKLTLLLSILGALVLGVPAYAGPLQSARSAFKVQDYDAAIKHYRKYLRNHRRDYDIWNELAASYYHAGLPKRALRYLRNVDTRTRAISYNKYYQGLSLIALDAPEAAQEALALSARYRDEYGSRAAFELGAIAYNARNQVEASRWLTYYAQAFPQGAHIRQVRTMLASIQQGRWIEEEVKGVDKMDSEQALYKHSSLSLIDYPHFWVFQLGGTTIFKSVKDPTQERGLQTRTEMNPGVIANFGLGVGPVRTDKTTSWAGYTYRQLWLTDQQRLNEFSESVDFSSQPFQLDLMRRDHSFFGDFRRQLDDNIFLGMYGNFGFARIGSSQTIGRDEGFADLQRTLPISSTQLLIPWVGVSYLENYRTLAYIYFRKEINEDNPEFSNRSYSLFGNDAGAFSFGLSHQMSFPQLQLDAGLELFRYEFIVNDYWLDYTRTGAAVTLENQFLPGLFVTLNGGYYQDEYKLPTVKTGSCRTVITSGRTAPGSSPEGPPVRCHRDDSGWMVQFGVYWNYSQFHRIAFNYLKVENQNPHLQEFDEVRQEITVVATMAFPSVKRVLRYTERFADLAFTKEPE